MTTKDCHQPVSCQGPSINCLQVDSGGAAAAQRLEAAMVVSQYKLEPETGINYYRVAMFKPAQFVSNKEYGITMHKECTIANQTHIVNR